MQQVDFATELVRLRPVLRLLTHRFTHDKDMADELVQDTLFRAFLYRDKFRENTNLNGWLFTIMRNIYINNYRESKRHDVRRHPTELRHLRIEDVHTSSRPDAQMQLGELWNLVNQVRDELQLPFKMHATGYKYEEIAKQLRIPIGTVKNRIFNARKEIQKKLHGYR